MLKFRGIIALDIDGTITAERYTLSPVVTDFFNQLIKEQWGLIFISGRTFAFARPVLSSLMGSYYFAVQNGAALYHMPNVQQIKKHYLPGQALKELVPIFKEHGVGLLVEMGQEREDVCYYKPSDFSDEELVYVHKRRDLSYSAWVAVEDFAQLQITEFAVGKFFASKEKAEYLAKCIMDRLPYPTIVIQDPCRPGCYLAHINATGASKGHILEKFRVMQGSKIPVIAAGDDYNDMGMLQVSDVKIVMANAPKSMHAMADILAKPAQQHGIIDALKQVIYGRDFNAS
ncbi:MAG: HAD family phosphatase [Verrucomicrobia bacterium]|nr:HAD family phosphatase [Verrucomicrobiota bacterium]MBS0646067.1 HAD family phosphatase [Verrucomicrobiota bacterium]